MMGNSYFIPNFDIGVWMNTDYHTNGTTPPEAFMTASELYNLNLT